MINFLLKFSETDKRVILFILFFLVIALVLLGVIFDAIRILIEWQGRDVKRFMAGPVDSGTISNERHFKKIAYRKSRVLFYKKYRFTVLFGLLAFMIYGIVSMFYRHWVNIFDYEVEGFTTLLYIFDLKNAPRANFFGIEIINQIPEPISRPHFSALAIPSYVLAPLFLYVIVSALTYSLGLFSRMIAIKRLAKEVFTPDFANKKIHEFTAHSDHITKEGLNKPNSQKVQEQTK